MLKYKNYLLTLVNCFTSLGNLVKLRLFLNSDFFLIKVSMTRFLLLALRSIQRINSIDLSAELTFFSSSMVSSRVTTSQFFVFATVLRSIGCKIKSLFFFRVDIFDTEMFPKSEVKFAIFIAAFSSMAS